MTRDMDHHCIGNGCRFAGCENQIVPVCGTCKGEGWEPIVSVSGHTHDQLRADCHGTGRKRERQS